MLKNYKCKLVQYVSSHVINYQGVSIAFACVRTHMVHVHWLVYLHKIKYSLMQGYGTYHVHSEMLIILV
jgi:hypothetical protein